MCGVSAGRGKTNRSQTVGVIHRFDSSTSDGRLRLEARAGADTVRIRASAPVSGLLGGRGGIGDGVRPVRASRANGEKSILGAVRPVGTDVSVGIRMPSGRNDSDELEASFPCEGY